MQPTNKNPEPKPNQNHQPTPPKKPDIQLNEEQKAAVKYLDGPLLVLAGPGTGKTQLLSSKVAYILENTDSGPDSILCMTFTDAGAMNMRERLKTIIGPAAAAKVTIGTYHSFGSDILARYKAYSEDYDRNLDEVIDDVKKYKLIKKFQDDLPGTDLLRGDSVKDIINIISSAKSHQLTAADLKHIAEVNEKDVEVLNTVCADYLDKLVPRKLQENLDNVYGPIATLFDRYQDTEDICPGVERLISPLARDLAKARAEAEGGEKPSIAPLSKWLRDNFEKDKNNRYRLKGTVANKKLFSIAGIMDRYEQHLRDEKLFDFDDMIQEAIKALKTDEGFRLTLTEKYQYIFLDEFQDTNPSQLEIIKQLTAYENPIIMAVGDDDQAIFEFQGAKSTNLKDFKDYYNAKEIALTQNYRSYQEILDFSNQVIVQADGHLEKNLEAARKNPAAPQIERHEFLSSDAEYFWIAQKISDLIAQGVPQKEIAILARRHRELVEIVPYLKAHPEINIAYEKQENLLADPKIATLITICRYVNDLAQSGRSTVNLFEVLSQPFWGVKPLDVLRVINYSRHNHKSALECIADSGNEKLQAAANFLAALALKSLEEPFEIIIDYLLGTLTLDNYRSRFLEHYTLTELPDAANFTSEADFKKTLIDAKNAEYATFNLYENLATLRSKVRAHFPKSQVVKLADFVEMINDYAFAGAQISSTSPYRDSDNAVQVMSSHKSKGLEFKYVFIPTADDGTWGSAKGNNDRTSLPKNLKHIHNQSNTLSTLLRLFYVSATRARDYLYITNSCSNFNGKKLNRLGYLNESEQKEDGEKFIQSPLLPLGDKHVTLHYVPEGSPEDMAAAKKSTDLATAWSGVYRQSTPDMLEIYREKLKTRTISATNLTSFIDIRYSGPEVYFINNVLGAPSEPTSESLAYGNVVHHTFEKITKEHISDEDALNFALEDLEAQDCDTTIKRVLRDKIPVDLPDTLTNFGSILRSPSAKAEVDLFPERLTLDDTALGGRLDHIEIDETNKTIELYDYKTSKHDKKYDQTPRTKGDVWLTRPSLFFYSLQLTFYKLLLNLSPTYSKYTVTTGHILFVTPNKERELRDLRFTFNPETDDLVKKLIHALAYQLSSLDFVNDPELRISPDSSVKMPDIKAFIDLVLTKSHQLPHFGSTADDPADSDDPDEA